MGRLIGLSDEYSARVAFLLVTIRDAGHPDPGTPAHAARLAPDAPAEKRLQVIRASLAHFDIPFSTLLDADGAAERAYSAFPKRLVVVDSLGRIAYDGARGTGGGPSDWDLEEVERHLHVLVEPSP